MERTKLILVLLLTAIFPCHAWGYTPAPGSSGQQIDNSSGYFHAYTLAGDCIFSDPNITCTKSNGSLFKAAAFEALGNAIIDDGAGNLTIGSATVTNAMLAGSIAASKLVGTDINTLGTITAGTWQGTVIGSSYGGAGSISGALKGNGSGTVSQAACGDLSNAAASCSTDATNASNISTGTLAAARLPNPSATTLGGIKSLAAVSSNWINTISTSGVPSATQPAESDLSFTDITTGNVTSTKHGFAPKSPADATKFLNGDTTNAYAQVKDSDLSTSDITTNNVSTTKHGFAPKLPNDATKYLDGTGAYSVPAGGGGGGGSSNGNNTVIYSDNGLTLTAGTRYAPIGGGGVPSSTESDVSVAAPSATTLLNLQVNLSVAPGVGQTLVVTARKNGVDTTLTCTISGASTTCQDLTHTVSIAQNDVINWKIVTTGTYVSTPTMTITAGVGGAVNTATANKVAGYSATGATVSGLNFNIDQFGHLISAATGTPTIAAGTGAGTSPTISITGNDVCGVINLTTGSTPTQGGTIATISFANAYATAPKSVILTQAAIVSAAAGKWYAGATTTTTWKIENSTSGLVAASAYAWYYCIIG